MSARRRPRRRRRTAEAGVSLIEVLCAVTLFAMIAAGTATLTAQSMRHTVANRHASAAALLAQWKLEEMRGRGYADVTSHSESSSMSGQNYTVTATVDDDDPAPNMKRLVITVDWTGPEGTREHEIETIFTSLRG
jgi:prepilin-type N-terminal cleavage/methylation domain-containing protein